MTDERAKYPRFEEVRIAAKSLIAAVDQLRGGDRSPGSELRAPRPK